MGLLLVVGVSGKGGKLCEWKFRVDVPILHENVKTKLFWENNPLTLLGEGNVVVSWN